MKLTTYDSFSFGSSGREGRDIELDESLSVGELTRLMAHAWGLDLEARNRGWLLSTDDGRAYAQGPERVTQSVAEFLRDTGSRALALAEQEVCMHGSPGVPGRGFLCGWC